MQKTNILIFTASTCLIAGISLSKVTPYFSAYTKYNLDRIGDPNITFKVKDSNYTNCVVDNIVILKNDQIIKDMSSLFNNLKLCQCTMGYFNFPIYNLGSIRPTNINDKSWIDDVNNELNNNSIEVEINYRYLPLPYFGYVLKGKKICFL